MARVRKTQSGARAQPVGAVAGQQYGAGVDQMAMQRMMPAPQVQGAPPAAAPVAAPGAAPAAPTAAGDPAMLMQLAQSMAPETGLLTAPTARPNEPVTAGLSRGPGVGPQALAAPQGSPAGNMLRRLTEVTGDPSFRALADKARA